ncbi:MAG: hypothetical protein ACYC2H_10945 [Thermoplasmatota archaeon]
MVHLLHLKLAAALGALLTATGSASATETGAAQSGPALPELPDLESPEATPYTFACTTIFGASACLGPCAKVLVKVEQGDVILVPPYVAIQGDPGGYGGFCP